MAKGREEKPTMLGDRVYRKHRKMLAYLMKHFGVKRRAEALRMAIEESYERATAKSGAA